MIHKYQQWLDESEKLEAVDTPVTPDAPVEAPAEVPAEPVAEVPAETPVDAGIPAEAPVEDDTAESEIEKYQELDTARRDAIKAFKKKQEEFLEIPNEIRKSPVEEADKTKVETLKSELVELNKTMKDSIKAWDNFNSEALGLADDETSEEYEP
jgi:hypothetical protein